MFFSVFSQVAILMILILTGVVLSKTGVLTEKGADGMTELVLLLVTPCVIIQSFIRKFDKETLRALLTSFLIAILIHVFFIVTSRLLIHTKQITSERVLRFAVIFTNCGYMSIPLQKALLGEIGVFYASSFVAIFNLIAWSYGVVLMSGEKKYLSPKKLLLNPGMTGLLIGLIIFLLSIPMPDIVVESISHIAALNTPLPMLVIGFHLAQTNVFKGFRDLRCLWATAVRMLLMPAAVLAILYFCGLRGDMLVSFVISASAPCAAVTTMFAAKYESDTALSVKLVSLTTCFSLISMPVLITIAKMLA